MIPRRMLHEARVIICPGQCVGGINVPECRLNIQTSYTVHIMCDGDLSLDLHDPGQTPGALLLGCRGEHLILAAVEDKIRVKIK